MSKVSQEYSITIEKLLNIVHSYTDPIRINVIIDNPGLIYEEAIRMKDFALTSCLKRDNETETERLLKYYKDVPVWNLTVWHDFTYFDNGDYRSGFAYGIQANCYYSDIRNGYLAEKVDIAKKKRKEQRQKAEENVRRMSLRALETTIGG
jgi:hypothetical protein